MDCANRFTKYFSCGFCDGYQKNLSELQHPCPNGPRCKRYRTEPLLGLHPRHKPIDRMLTLRTWGISQIPLCDETEAMQIAMWLRLKFGKPKSTDPRTGGALFEIKNENEKIVFCDYGHSIRGPDEIMREIINVLGIKYVLGIKL